MPEEKKEKYVAIDFETYYDKASGYTLTNMTPFQYVNDSRFDAYLVSIATEDGTCFARNPADVDWSAFKGATFIAHNAAFDGLVLLALQARGIVPKIAGTKWACTADMSVFLGYPRTLAGASEAILGEKVSKQIRGDMDGKHFIDAVNEGFAEALVKYAEDDARLCLKLWLKCHEQFPSIERKVSSQNRLSGRRGVKIDIDACHQGIKTLTQALARAESLLPWVAEGKASGSTVELNRYCVERGVEPPTTWNRKDLAFKKWLEANPSMEEIVDARLIVAGMGAHISRLTKLTEQVDDNGIMHPSNKYFGSHTGRYASGRTDEGAIAKSGPVNLLNLPKAPVHGVNMRSVIVPRPGHKFVIVDYSQIEPRVALWLAKDTEALDAIAHAEGKNLYWPVALRLGWITPETTLKEFKANADLYLLTKAVGIGLTYGMGSPKFFDVLRTGGIPLKPIPKDQWPELDQRLTFLIRNRLDLEIEDIYKPDNEAFMSLFFACDQVVMAWRAKNTKIIELHHRLEQMMDMPCSSDLPVFAFKLPSKRFRPYFKCHNRTVPKTTKDDTGKPITRAVVQRHAAVTYSSTAYPVYGGLLLENIVQSLSRDIMAYSAVAIEEANPDYHYIWSVHDELIFEVPEVKSEEALVTIMDMMCSNKYINSWIEGLPLAVEGGVRDCYGK